MPFAALLRLFTLYLYLVEHLQSKVLRAPWVLVGRVPGWVPQKFIGAIHDVVHRSEIRAKRLPDRKGECPWQQSPAGVQTAFLSWCPAIPGFDVAISSAAPWRGVLVRSPLATSCFGEVVRNAFFCLAVIDRVCSHQVLNLLRPPRGHILPV